MQPSELFAQWDAYAAASKLPPALWKPGCKPGRQSRRKANAAMRPHRRVPRERHLYKVIVTKLEIRAEVRAKSVKTMPRMANGLWLRSRKLARLLVEQDRSIGGVGWTTAIEYRRCRVCHRALLGGDAQRYRERQRWPIHTWDTPWGPKCGPDCKSRRRA